MTRVILDLHVISKQSLSVNKILSNKHLKFVSYIMMHDKKLIEISFGPVSSLRRYRSKSF